MKFSQSKFNPYRYTQHFTQPFSLDKLYSHPGNLNTYDHRGSRKQIGIIGGGIAGLTSAYELSQLGHKVTLLEASNRLGGRIRTHYFSDGTYGELGAMRIPASHRCTLHYVEKFNLPKRPFVSDNAAGFYHLRGKKARIDSVTKLFPAYNLSNQERQDPVLLLNNLLKELGESLSDEQKWEMFSPTFTSSKLKQYDLISFSQYFRERLSPDAFEMVGHATGMIHYEQYSLLAGLIDFFTWYLIDQYELIGGMETLVNAFVQQLSGKIECNTKVKAIQVTDRGVFLQWNSLGRCESREFDYVICSIPTTALVKIDFEPALPSRQREAIGNLRYYSATKTLFHCTSRPWELHNNIYGGGSFTDLSIQQCLYPSDNAQLVKDSGGIAQWIGINRELSHRPSVFIAAYRWDNNSRHFLTLDKNIQTDSTLREVKQLHPQIDQYLDDIVHFIWDEDYKSGSGASAYFAPREHERYQEPLCQPYPLDNPRVFFAGEHLAINHAWIQGAIQTALSATINILQAPSGSLREDQ